MNILKYTLTIILITVLNSCQAQSQKMKYFFSKEVNSEIDIYIQKILSEQGSTSFYLTLYRETMFEEAGNYSVHIGSYTDTDVPINATNELIKSTTRYYQSGTIEVPVIFDYDFEFASYGVDDKGRVLRKQVIQHSYSIEFDRKGNIVPKEN